MTQAWWDWDHTTIYVSYTGIPEDKQLLWKWAKLRRTRPIAWMTLAATATTWLSVLVSALFPQPVRTSHLVTALGLTFLSAAALAWLHHLRPENKPRSALSLHHSINLPAAGTILEAFAAVDNAALEGKILPEHHEQLREEMIEMLFTKCPLPAGDGRSYKKADQWITHNAAAAEQALWSYA